MHSTEREKVTVDYERVVESVAYRHAGCEPSREAVQLHSNSATGIGDRSLPCATQNSRLQLQRNQITQLNRADGARSGASNRLMPASAGHTSQCRKLSTRAPARSRCDVSPLQRKCKVIDANLIEKQPLVRCRGTAASPPASGDRPLRKQLTLRTRVQATMDTTVDCKRADVRPHMLLISACLGPNLQDLVGGMRW